MASGRMSCQDGPDGLSGNELPVLSLASLLFHSSQQQVEPLMSVTDWELTDRMTALPYRILPAAQLHI